MATITPPDRDPTCGSGPGPGHVWEAVSWVLDVALIFATGPLGLFLTFAHAAGHDLIGNILQGLFGSRKKTARPAASAAKSGAKKEEGRFAGVRHADAGATARTVFGWILAGFGIVAAIGAVGTGEGLWHVLSMIAVALGGGALVWSGFMGRKKEAKFRQCISITGQQGVVDMQKLARTMGVKPAEADKLLTEMVDRGYYGERAYIDHERQLLVIDVEDMRDVYRREDEPSSRPTRRPRPRIK